MRMISSFENRLFHRIKKLSSLILGALVSATCLIPPRFAHPRANDNARNAEFPYKTYSETEVAAALQRPLTLEDCIGIALRKSIPLRIAQGDLERAEAARAGSYGAFLPVFSLDASRDNSLSEDAKGFDLNEDEVTDSLGGLIPSRFANQASIAGKIQLYTLTGASLQLTKDFFHDVNMPLSKRSGTPDALTSKIDNASYAVRLSQPLLRGAGPTVARGSVISTGYDRQMQEWSLLDDKLQTVFTIKRVYYDALSKRELLKVNEAAVRSDSALVKASQALILAKLASRRDVLSAEIRLADDLAALIKAQNDYQRALDALKDIMGLPIGMLINVDETGLSFVLVTLDEPALIRRAVEGNPALQSLAVAIKRGRLQRSLAKNALLPQLNLEASYSSNLGKDLVLNQNSSKKGGWQAAVSLSYAFLNRDAAADAEIAEIAVRQQEDRLLDQQRQIVVSIREIVRSVYTSAEEIKAIEQGIKAAEEKLDFANTMFNLGRASNFDVTESQEFLLKAKTQYLRKLVDYHTQLALLESLTGQPITP